MNTDRTIDYIAWVKRTNARWLTHYNLSLNAEAYLNHLAQIDASRLRASCHNAYLMIWQRDQREDPKPWFYSGLFSLAREAEARKFLIRHWSARDVIPSSKNILIPLSERLNEMSLEKIRSLQEAMAKLPDFPPEVPSYW